MPLTALTVEQLVLVAESDPPGEKKAIRGSAEDKEEYARLVDEATRKSKENTPNSTKELVEWMFKKFLRAIANGVIRTIIVDSGEHQRSEVFPASKEGNLVKRKQQ